MADFNNLALTVKGVKALLEAQTGTALTLSKIGMGSGFTTNSTSLTGLVTPEVMLPISSKKIDSELGFLTVTARITNEDITEGFYWRETGLFFEDSDGNDILFAYSCVDTKYDYVPAYSDRRYVKHIRIADIITDKADIEVKETAGLLYVDTLTFNEFQEEFKSHDHDDLYYSKNEVNAIRNALETLINAKPSTLAALGITASATELNYMDGVTSGVQGQLNKKVESLSDLGITASASRLNNTAAYFRSSDKKITDIETAGAVYVTNLDDSKTMPIVAEEFSTSSGHKLTSKANQTDLDGINPFKGVFNYGNIDELMTYGVYWVQLNQNSTTITGTIPPYVNTQFGYFEVIKAYKEGTDCMQRFTEYFGGVVHTRVYVNGSWTGWKTYNLNDYLPLAGGTLTGMLTVKNGSNGSVRLRSDGEGGNIEIHSPSSYNSYWEIDAYNGNLRAYRNNGGNIEQQNHFPATSGTLLNENSVGDAAFKSCQDSTSAGTLSSSGTGLCTERDVYYGLPTINGSHSYTSATNIYAPTSVGSSEQVLVSNGSGAPSWKDLGSVSSSTGMFTYGSDATYFTSGNSSVSIKKHGKVVTISGYIYGVNNGSTNDVEFTVGTVPSGFRPPSNVYGLAWYGGGSDSLKDSRGNAPFIINSSGVMTMTAIQTTYSGRRMHFTTTYIIS